MTRAVKSKLGIGVIPTAAAMLLLGFTASNASAQSIVLEGSDATSFHQDVPYTGQLFSYLAEGSSNPVLVFGSVNLSGAPGGTNYTTDLSTLSFATSSALYIQSPGGCCDDNRTGALVFEAQITAFMAAGGSLAIQDYQGGNWGTILSFVAPSSAIGGLGGGAGGPGCFDTEVFNANGLSKGFTQPPVLGCWGHQAYDMAFFGPLGFNSLVDSGSEFAGLGSGNWSSFLALGGTIGTPGGVPEPGTWAMMLFGFGATGFALRRRRSTVQRTQVA